MSVRPSVRLSACPPVERPEPKPKATRPVCNSRAEPLCPPDWPLWIMQLLVLVFAFRFSVFSFQFLFENLITQARWR